MQRESEKLKASAKQTPAARPAQVHIKERVKPGLEKPWVVAPSVLPEVIHVEPVSPPKIVSLTKEEATDLVNLAQVASENPGGFIKAFAEKIPDKNIAPFAAADLADKLQEFNKQISDIDSLDKKIEESTKVQQAPSPVMIFKAIAEKYPNQEIIDLTAQSAVTQDQIVCALSSQKEYYLNETIRALYGLPAKGEALPEYRVSPNVSPNSIEIGGKSFQDIANGFEKERKRRQGASSQPGFNFSQVQDLASSDLAAAAGSSG